MSKKVEEEYLCFDCDLPMAGHDHSKCPINIPIDLPEHTCKVSVPVAPSVVPYGWQLCEKPAVTVLKEVRQYKFKHSEQYVKYLCVDHSTGGIEEGVALPPYKEPKARARKEAAS